MNEKSPRRAPLALTAEQLDYKESQARSDNKRARNRLHISKEVLKGHESTNVSSLDYEMRRLKHELRGIKQTSGYFVVNHDNPDEAARVRHRHKRKSRTKVAKKKYSMISKTTDSIYEVRESEKQHQNTKTVSLPTLPTISSASSDSSGKNGSKSQESNKISDINNHNNDNAARFTVTLESKAPKSNRKISNSTYLNATDTTLMREQEKSVNSDEKDLTGDRFLGVDFEAARNRVQNRLGANEVSSTFQVDDNDDLTPYMHVPPDGLPRTAYLLPPLEQLLTEAKKARYIRKLRKRDTVLEEDDPERELGIDEIFSKSR